MQGDLWGRAPLDWAEGQEPLHMPLFLAMLEAAGVAAGTRLCDLGCGGGTASVAASGRGARVTGLDASAPLIDVARKRLPAAAFHVGDLEALPFDERSFDVVFAANSVQYAEDRVAALAEMRRVCAPEGKIVAGLWGPPEQVEFRAVFAAIRDALPTPPPGKGPFELSAPGALATLLGEAGLTVVGNGTAACPFSYPDFPTFWRINRAAGPVQGALRMVSEETLSGAVRDALAPFQRPDGGYRFENVFQFVLATP